LIDEIGELAVGPVERLTFDGRVEIADTGDVAWTAREGCGWRQKGKEQGKRRSQGDV
jgi:hypothetical protein